MVGAMRRLLRILFNAATVMSLAGRYVKYAVKPGAAPV